MNTTPLSHPEYLPILDPWKGTATDPDHECKTL